MDKGYTVVVAPMATAMLYDHVDFLSRVSENAAFQLISEFEDTIESLRQMPDRHPWYDPDNQTYRKVLVYKRYLSMAD